MRDFSLQSGETRLTLAGALLLYADPQSHEINYITKHEAQQVGTAEAPNEQIMPGTPVTSEGLIAMFEQLTKTYSLNTDILPENVLSISGEHMVWWLPEGKRRVFFHCAELGQRWGYLPHPPLLFLVVKESWYVFALPKNERPTGETALCHAPYFNVYDNHSICVGSANIPRKASVSAIPEWEAAFFDSEFTHPNGSITKSSHPRGEYAMWKELLDDVYETFPMQFLVPTKKSLADMMVQLRKQMGAK
jgi:PRTRC genetic system protein B